ncbi:MAG: phosphonate metabolism transcriptional regulator PhnF [Pseudomonadota bacterium]
MTQPSQNATPVVPDGAPHSTLQRGGGLALWRQIADRLRERIIEGSYAVGSKIPNEIDLADQMAVHRHTVRKAISALRQDGLLEARRGEGTFVARDPLPYPLATNTRFHEIVSGEGRVPHGELVEHGLRPAPVAVTQALNLETGSQALSIQSVHRADGIPISTANSWFDPARFSTLAADFAELGSLTKAMNRHGVTRYGRRGTTISARPANSVERQRLDIAADAIVMVTAYVNYDQDGAPIQMAETSFAASRIRLIISDAHDQADKKTKKDRAT